jgi:2-dehydropantoate 2-reductase
MGAGSLGCVTGGFMANAGHHVHLVGRKTHMDAIHEKGLTIKGIWGDHHVTSLHTHTSVSDLPDIIYDFVILAVKSYDTDAALTELEPRISEETLICSYQNGLGNSEKIAQHYGWDRCVESRVIYGARINQPAEVEVTVMARKTALGIYKDTPYLEKIKTVALAMDASGVPTEYAENIEDALWAKLAYNCSLNPLSALLDVPYGGLLESEKTKTTMREVIHEFYLVGHALKIKLNPPTPEAYIDLLFGTLIPNTADHYASTREDLKQKRRTEIDALNGAIVQHGKNLKIPTPTNEKLTQQIKDREREYL